jgi:hypothetical protein
MPFTPASGFLLALVIVAPPLLAGAALPPPAPGAPAVVVTAPWRSAQDAVTRAGGVMLRDGRTGGIALSYSPDPGYADALRAAGAWAVLSADLADALCGAAS